MPNHQHILASLKEIRTTLTEKMAAEVESLPFGLIRDLAAVQTAIEAVEIEATRETFGTPLNSYTGPDIGPWTDA